MVSNNSTAALCLTALILAITAPSTALACDMAEKLRLAEEQKKLASRNAWTGVERSYEALLETKCELDFDQHFLGAESARVLGKTWEQYERLQKALQFEDKPEIREAMESIDANYGRVDIQGDPRRRPTLERPEMPFAPDQRKAIEWAQTVIDNTGSFYGMLPQGSYVVGEVDLVVETGPDFQLVQVGKVKGPKGPKPEGGSGGSNDQSAVNYANLVATIGPAFTGSSEGKMTELQDGGHQFVPASVGASGFGLQVGGEIGLTYAEPVAGIAAVVGYQGGYGQDTLHDVHLWVAGVVRPGEFRFALGPQYAMAFGRGTGVAEAFDRGQGQPNDSIQWGGLAWGPGLQASAGYGLLDFDKLRGVVELGGSWHSDGARSYFGAGLRVGVVPTVPRFKG
jgi:hypothetical protein